MEIQLGGKKGGIALVDAEDYEKVSKYMWCKDKQGYAYGMVDGILTLMHRFILGIVDENVPIDHINRSRIDNQKHNLRPTTPKLNCQNKSVNKNKKGTKFHGVFFMPDKKNKYRVTIRIDNVAVPLGHYATELEAAETYDMYMVHNKNEYAPLNFPEKKEIYLARKYVPHKKPIKQCNYIGVVRKGNNSYDAKIKRNNKTIHIMINPDELTCAKAYDKYIVDNKILNKKLNFPKDHPEYKPVAIIKTDFEPTDNKDVIRLIIKSKPAAIVLIDKCRYDEIKYYAWCISNGYLKTTIGKKSVLYSRFIMKINDPKIFIDHIDNNTYNNCENNFRISNSQKNSQNKAKSKYSSSKYFGVTYNGHGKKRWVANICCNYIHHYIGHFVEEKYAARSRDLFILIHFPNEHYKLNFEWTDNDIEEWRNKLIPLTNNEIWIPKSDTEKQALTIGRIVDAFDKDQVFKAGTLLRNVTKSNKFKVTEQLILFEKMPLPLPKSVILNGKFAAAINSNNLTIVGELNQNSKLSTKTLIDQQLSVLNFN